MYRLKDAMKQLFINLSLVVYSASALAQEVHDTIMTEKNLPFFIHDSKKLPDFELSEKKEGTFVTGLPRFEFDPIRGFGAGGNVNLFMNKTRDDPFFDYTAYRHKINAEFFIFQNGRIRYAINYDAPYIFQSKWRLRADAVHWDDPNAQYWGIGRNSLNRLKFKDKATGEIRTFNRVKEYERNLAIAEPEADGNYYTDYHYHHFHQREQLYTILGERIMSGGKLRLLFGYEALFTSFTSHKGQIAEEAYLLSGEKTEAVSRSTLVDKEIADGTWDRFNLSGFNNNDKYMFTSMLAAALIYDTRDFEPDPSNGTFLQYSHE